MTRFTRQGTALACAGKAKVALQVVPALAPDRKEGLAVADGDLIAGLNRLKGVHGHKVSFFVPCDGCGWPARVVKLCELEKHAVLENVVIRRGAASGYQGSCRRGQGSRCAAAAPSCMMCAATAGATTAVQDGRDWGERETVGVEDAEDGVNVIPERVVEVEIGLGEGRRVPAEIGEDGLGRARVVLDDQRLLNVHEFPYTDGASRDGAMGVPTATYDLEGWRAREERERGGGGRGSRGRGDNWVGLHDRRRLVASGARIGRWVRNLHDEWERERREGGSFCSLLVYYVNEGGGQYTDCERAR